ncbi:MAG TPA: hypothetical protein VGP99_09725 [Tepidisphaeraceae bacterium]|nr:hypothetical protein [Tepidisphaeraceae bacterium]
MIVIGNPATARQQPKLLIVELEILAVEAPATRKIDRPRAIVCVELR